MTVQVKSERKGVEISWEPLGSGDVGGGTPPGEFPQYPVDPGYGIEEGGPPQATHPIYLPPYIDNSLPGNQPGIDNSLPGNQPVIDNSLPEIEEIGLSDEQIEKLKSFFEGNLPPFEGRPEPTPVGGKGGKQIAVQVFGQGQDGDWSNTAVQPNDGLAFLSYPDGFVGESYIEVRALDGTLVDSGAIQVGSAQE